MRSELIKARGEHSQTDVASKIGISQKYLSKLERGQRTPSLKIAVKIAAYYNKSVEQIFPDIFLQEKTPFCSKN